MQAWLHAKAKTIALFAIHSVKAIAVALVDECIRLINIHLDVITLEFDATACVNIVSHSMCG